MRILKFICKTVMVILLFNTSSCFRKDNHIYPYPQVTDIESNDSFSEAVSADINSIPLVGYFNNKNGNSDKDYYLIDFKSKVGSFRFTLTGVPGVDSRVSIYDMETKLLFSTDDSGIGEAEIAWRYYSSHSKLYICIESKSGYNEAVPYIFTITPEARDNLVEIEPNNSIETANFIEIGTTLKGYIVPSNDIDYYKIEFGDQGIKDFRVKVESLSGIDIVMEIIDIDSGSSKVVNNFSTGGTEISQAFGSDKGNYYVKISGSITDSRKEPLYYIAIEELPYSKEGRTVYYERENNDTIDTATQILHGEEITGTIEKDDIDFFRLDIFEKAGRLNVSIDGIQDRRFSAVLYNSDGEEITRIDGQNNFFIRDVNPGRYYLSIERNVPGSFLYNLFYSTEPFLR